MRSYPRNSPEAAARLVALVLISDGHVCNAEFNVLTRVDAAQDLGVAPPRLHGIVQALCEDLLMDGFDGGSILSHLDHGSLACLVAEVEDQQLRGTVLRLAAAAALADTHLSAGESLVLDEIARHWGMRPVIAVG